MSIKTIMSACSPDRSDEDFKAALDLCVEANAHLLLVIVAVAPAMPASEFDSGLALEWQQIRQTDLDRIADKAAHVRDVLDQSGISYSVETEYADRGWLDDAIGIRARYSDLVCLSRNMLDANKSAGPLLEGSIFQSARPVMIVPTGFTPTLRPKKVLVAWDSRREAARAVYDALDMLSSSEEICVAVVDPVASDIYQGAEPGADIALYLARHGLHVTVEQLASGGRSVAEVLKQHATDMSADLLVMGAYGHSRVRERIFGGVTLELCEAANLPILMAH
jgi:nucleotide-binding universal stress UspA family protein